MLAAVGAGPRWKEVVAACAFGISATPAPISTSAVKAPTRLRGRSTLLRRRLLTAIDFSSAEASRVTGGIGMRMDGRIARFPFWRGIRKAARRWFEIRHDEVEAETAV